MPVVGAFDLYGNPNFGLRDCVIGKWNSDGTYTNLMSLPSVQMFGITLKMTQAELEGNDVVTAVHAKPISADVQVRIGAPDIRVMGLILGGTAGSSGTIGNRKKELKVVSGNAPYFGIIGRSDASEGNGAFVMFVPKVKIKSDTKLDLQIKQFIVMEFTASAVPDNTYLDSNGDAVIMSPIIYETIPVLTLPPPHVA